MDSSIVEASSRSAEKAKLLAANEITPVVGNVEDISILTAVIVSASIDIVVDATSAHEESTKVLEAVTSASKLRFDNLAKENAIGPKLGFIYTSGQWVHGSPSGRVSDLSPVGNSLAKGSPATLVDWRPAHEQTVLAAREYLDVAIMRPATIYGRGSWILTTWWSAFLDAKLRGNSEAIQIPADREGRTVTVHVDDLVAGYHAAIDRIDGRLGSWPVFDLIGETVSIADMMEATRKAIGLESPIEYMGSNGNPFLKALNLVSTSDGARARTVLGWEAKRRGFVRNLPVYFEAWKVTQEGI
jgi:hypothetical protein